VDVVEVNGPDIKAENDFTKNLVKPTTRTATAQEKRLRYSFPAHSYTMLKVKLA
jgi:alpha-N-arabinofuranosidase